jgi:predicted enzyme related to lactoylglutathione lyase
LHFESIIMNRVVHFEIQAENIDRAIAFYTNVFGWQFPKWMDNYWGVMTAEKDSKEPGINGGLLQRPCPAPAVGQGVNAFVCTVQVDSFDETAKKIQIAGGTVAMPKMAIVGMAWQGYFLDTEGNIFGVHQADVNAK